MKSLPRESITEKRDTKAKAQLMRAVADAVKSDEMAKATMEGIYYQPFPVLAEIPNKGSWHAFTEVGNKINMKPYRTPEKLWQENEQELEPEETKEFAF